MLRMSAAAEKRGLDKQPKFEEMLHFARMQILSQELSSALQEDSRNIPDSDIEDYYKKNESAYEASHLRADFRSPPTSKSSRKPQTVSDASE